MGFLSRIRAEVLTRSLLDPTNGPIQALKRREISFNGRTYHRIRADSTMPGVSGVGVSSDPTTAQVKAMMECLERSHFRSNTKARKTTSGLSCHFSRRAATRRAILELVERDQVLLTVYHASRLVEIVGEPGVRFFRMTHDIPVHVVMAQISTENGGRCFGFGCDLELSSAREKALLEALVVHDSRNVDPPDQLNDQLWHLVPFVQPDRWSSALKPFSIDDYEIIQTKEAPQTYTWPALMGALSQKSLPMSVTCHHLRVLPLLSLWICDASSEALQSLFFSPSEIRVNPKRATALGYPKVPRLPVLHPVS